ncbi:nucleotidyltransferase family protein [candidate division KSB1 bacterium]|nr:nucleotidyltransferase family protein [candidate division KSB1 bacterium]
MTAFPIDNNKLIEICREHNVAQLGVFGSMARGEADEQSDIDLLMEFSKPTSLLGLIGLEQQLEHAFGRMIDLLTKAALSPYLRDRILQELRVIYEAG